jgi:PPOX class probable F420-dependent enzyme
MEPNATRPHMPGYGILPATEGTGLLPWSWAVERLTASHDYWVTTTWADGRPHLTPVWGAWLDDAVWFSCSPTSRKTKNLERDPRCSIATDNPYEPVIVEARAARTSDGTAVRAFTDAVNAKYETDYDVDFYGDNALWVARPTSVFALDEADFPGSPTRWTLTSDK